MKFKQNWRSGPNDGHVYIRSPSFLCICHRLLHLNIWTSIILQVYLDSHGGMEGYHLSILPLTKNYKGKPWLTCLSIPFSWFAIAQSMTINMHNYALLKLWRQEFCQNSWSIFLLIHVCKLWNFYLDYKWLQVSPKSRDETLIFDII